MVYAHIQILSFRERFDRGSVVPFVVWRLYRFIRKVPVDVSRKRAYRLAHRWAHKWVLGYIDLPWEVPCIMALIEPLAQLMFECDVIEYMQAHPWATAGEAAEAVEEQEKR